MSKNQTVQTETGNRQQEIEIGDIVWDEETDDALLVVEVFDELAGEKVIPALQQTVAEYNDCPEDEAVVSTVYTSALDKTGIEWRGDVSQTVAEIVAEERDIRTYSFPAGRVEAVREDELGISRAAQIGYALDTDGIDYEALVEEMDGDSLTDVYLVREAFNKTVESHHIGGEDGMTVLETLFQQFGSYQTVEDILVDARQGWIDGSKMAVDDHTQSIAHLKAARKDRYEKLDADHITQSPIVISDSTDVDGEMCMTLYEAAFEDALVLPTGHGGFEADRTIEAVFERVLSETPTGTPIYVADIAPSDEQAWIDAIADHGGSNPIKIRDHHSVSDELIEAVEESHPQSEYQLVPDAPAAASIVLEHDVDLTDVSSPYSGVSDSELAENLRDATAVAEVADAWQQDHSRWSDAALLRSLQYNFSFKKFAKAVSENGGDIRGTKHEMRIRQLSLVEDIQTAIAIGETAISAETESGINVSFVYGGDADRSEVGSALIDQGADIVGIFTSRTKIVDDGGKTARGKLSFRATDAAPVADQVAEAFNGGGREGGKAGSGYPDLCEIYDMPPEQAANFHVQTKAGQAFFWALENVIPEIDNVVE